jgi:hypothetical protein
MAFTIPINAARQTGLSVAAQGGTNTLTITYALSQYTPGQDGAPDTWIDVLVNRQDRSISLTLPAGAPVPSDAMVAGGIKADTAATFGAAVDHVLVNDTLF